jgi:uncharacterized cofD-like protein
VPARRSATGTWTVSEPRPPEVVALGGGHGLASTLQALRCCRAAVTAVVSVADDGGSTGRLRRDLGVIGVGDLRKALVALSDQDDTVWADAFEHRFRAGELQGHALGNLVLIALAQVTGDWVAALAIAGETLGARGRVLPATLEPVVLRAEVEGRPVEGQVAVQNASGRIRRITLEPAGARSPAAVVEAIERADLIVIAPGSLFTSVLPALAAEQIHAALATATAPVAAILNLAPQIPETAGLSGTDHLRALRDQGTRIDVAVVAEGAQLQVDPAAARDLGIEIVTAPVARPDAGGHAPAKLASVLAALLESGVTGTSIRNGQRSPEEGS